jgi:hypothetical protein|tara:strand:- start:943 stop:1215 length:273 start_codon:yes stop_codon:yes gene_type:complete
MLFDPVLRFVGEIADLNDLLVATGLPGARNLQNAILRELLCDTFAIAAVGSMAVSSDDFSDCQTVFCRQGHEFSSLISSGCSLIPVCTSL